MQGGDVSSTDIALPEDKLVKVVRAGPRAGGGAVINQLRGIFRQPEVIIGRGAPRGPGRTTSPRRKRARRSRSSTRCGTNCSRPSRRGSCICWSSGSMCGCMASRSGCGRTESPGSCVRWRAAGGLRRDAGDNFGRRRNDHGPHPDHVPEARRAGKLVVTPDGAAWAARPRVNNAMVKALARAFRWRKMLDRAFTRRSSCPGEGRERDLCQPHPAAYAAGAGYRGGNPRWVAACGAAAG